ncbi:UPF0193 protein EVG1 [Spea bombifrons]|uniref:UPF0193 protein EVG1 n=1 Tax=Spea bombifrons TaxID=233779 RepID=UPI00234B59A5|nr:UPF0193 protein EVG1 [Spea bombifrons]
METGTGSPQVQPIPLILFLWRQKTLEYTERARDLIMSLKGGNVNVQVGAGFWNSAKPVQYSKETQELLRVMMQESKLTNFQQRQIRERLQCGDVLPTQCHPSSSNSDRKPPCVPAQRLSARVLRARPSLRPAEQCRAGDAYDRDKFRPRPTRDLNKEKHRLQNIMATGKDLPETKHASPQVEEAVLEEKDRFDELMAEIKERWEFLTEMEALGRGKEYHNIISTEISQKLREMELIDKQRSAELRDALKLSENKKPDQF